MSNLLRRIWRRPPPNPQPDPATPEVIVLVAQRLYAQCTPVRGEARRVDWNSPQFPRDLKLHYVSRARELLTGTGGRADEILDIVEDT